MRADVQGLHRGADEVGPLIQRVIDGWQDDPTKRGPGTAVPSSHRTADRTRAAAQFAGWLADPGPPSTARFSFPTHDGHSCSSALTDQVKPGC